MCIREQTTIAPGDARRVRDVGSWDRHRLAAIKWFHGAGTRPGSIRWTTVDGPGMNSEHSEVWEMCRTLGLVHISRDEDQLMILEP